MEDQPPCGAHPNNAFDHTCDDCMLPYVHLDGEDDVTTIEDRKEQ